MYRPTLEREGTIGRLPELQSYKYEYVMVFLQTGSDRVLVIQVGRFLVL